MHTPDNRHQRCLYFAIAAAGAASIATSAPEWSEQTNYWGPLVTLEAQAPQFAGPIVLRTSHPEFLSRFDITGTVSYEVTGETPLALSLRTPDGQVIAQQRHSLTDTGVLGFSLELDRTPTCTSDVDGICEANYELSLETEANIVGTIDVHWEGVATLYGPEQSQPKGLVLALSIPGGGATSPGEIPAPSNPQDDLQPGAWTQQARAFFYSLHAEPEAQAVIVPFTARTTGQFSYSNLTVALTAHHRTNRLTELVARIYSDRAPYGDQSGDPLLLEYVVLGSGVGWSSHQFTLPKLADCPEVRSHASEVIDPSRCDRDYLIEFTTDVDPEEVSFLNPTISLTISGQGGTPPDNSSVQIIVPDSVAYSPSPASQDGSE